jgi:hypothetical protein
MNSAPSLWSEFKQSISNPAEMKPMCPHARPQIDGSKLCVIAFNYGIDDV